MKKLKPIDVRKPDLDLLCKWLDTGDSAKLDPSTIDIVKEKYSIEAIEGKISNEGVADLMIALFPTEVERYLEEKNDSQNF